MTKIKELLNNKILDRLDNRIILSKITGYNYAGLITYENIRLSKKELKLYYNLVKRRLNGEPVAYILGYKEFYSRNFLVNSNVLIPRPETELLVEIVLNKAPPGARILDLGTGSGCIAITLALERNDLVITATDSYLASLEVAKINASKLNVKLEFKLSDWYLNLPQELEFDFIVSNPPYISKHDEHLLDLRYEPKYALTDFNDGLTAIKQITQGSLSYLSSGGWLIIEHGYNQELEVNQIFAGYNLINVLCLKDYSNLARITLAQKPY